MTGWLWDFLFIIVISTVAVSLIIQGFIPLELGVVLMLALIVFRTIGRILGGGIGRTIRATFTVALPILSVLILAVTYSGGELQPMAGILMSMGTLFMVLFGIYIMIRGPFSK